MEVNGVPQNDNQTDTPQMSRVTLSDETTALLSPKEIKTNLPSLEPVSSTEDQRGFQTAKKPNILPENHPLMIQYQKDLKEQLLKLLKETDEQLLDLKRTICDQEKENNNFAERGYQIQKSLKHQEEKLENIEEAFERKNRLLQELQDKCQEKTNMFQCTKGSWENETKTDLEYRNKLEDVSFDVIQLSAMQVEASMDSKSLKYAFQKAGKDRENLEVQKLRQDLLLTRIENDKFALEDKLHMLNTQWAIKKEEAADVRKELIAARKEMEIIHSEKQQIIHQWRQSLSALEKQDGIYNEIGTSSRKIEDVSIILRMDISGAKKSLRKELERNEMLTFEIRSKESDIIRTEKAIKGLEEQETDLEGNVSVLYEALEISEHELKIIQDATMLTEKDIEKHERELRKAYALQKNLEVSHMNMLHEKITITTASKYTEKLIRDMRNSTYSTEEKCTKKENDKKNHLLKMMNLRTLLSKLEDEHKEVRKECAEREIFLNRCENAALSNRENMDKRRGEIRELNLQLQKMIAQAGGQELSPFERELSNLRKEIIASEQSKQNIEKEYLHSHNQLFSISKQSSVKAEKNDFFRKKTAVLEGKKIQCEADINKEVKEIKEVKNRIRLIENEIIHVCKVQCERKETQENLLQESALSKCDFVSLLKDAELNYLQKQNELRIIRRKKKKILKKLLDAQSDTVYWEGKIHLAEETKDSLRAENHLGEISALKDNIHRLEVKEEEIRKEKDFLVQEMSRAVYRYTSLYVEADKQAIFGKRRKTPDFVKKRIKHIQKEIQQDKKFMEGFNKELEVFKSTAKEIEEEHRVEMLRSSQMINNIRSLEEDMNLNEQVKRQAVLNLSFKQKKAKLLQKVLEGTYVRAVRNERSRMEEVQKLEDCLQAIQVILQATTAEYPDLKSSLGKISDYIAVSKLL